MNNNSHQILTPNNKATILCFDLSDRGISTLLTCFFMQVTEAEVESLLQDYPPELYELSSVPVCFNKYLIFFWPKEEQHG